ncbi:hypothetical protein GWC95_08315 [Sediminibacterium roseum]|uniref:MG2 domain-containing protein n=1 Tax=Sediminibacterium roseum TaxID=1978412 RepID=A0ABW9ZS36_9BACT|nr:hypothetical protein [Sediminibacterium roseum]NCI49922.1 hypothetical protein [Sediminibacterium roseum]
MIRYALCFCFVFFCTVVLRAQSKLEQVVDPIAAKMEWYGVKKKSAGLFVHFDKNIYTPSENVWFTAYLLSSKTGADANHTFAVALVRNEDSAVMKDEKFVMANGLGFGHFRMPDTLSPGNYSLLAFTNALWNGRPEACFIQPITIKTSVQSGFTATLKLADKIRAGSDSAAVFFKASAKDIRTLASGTQVTYTLGDRETSFKTDLFGAAHFRVPLKGIDRSNNRLRLKAVFNKETKNMQLLLPVSNDEPVVRFFPEGGSIGSGATNNIGWEAHDAYGQPMAISGVLFRNGETVDTIQTNGYGMGRFTIAAGEGEQYHVKLFRSGVLSGNYVLPAVAHRQILVTAPNAICNDTLLFYANAPSRGTYYALLHDYTRMYFSFAIDMNASPARRLRVPLDKIPRGIHALTIVDENGRPLAERIFFAHYNRRAKVEIATDKVEYAKRENVKLHISLKDALADSVNGFVSVACVQDSRIDRRKMTGIENFNYLNRELDEALFKQNLMEPTAENRQHLEDILLIKGWRRYTWQELETTKASDTLQSFGEIEFSGNVTSKKKIDKPLALSVASDGNADIINTNNKGEFTVARENLVTGPGKKVYFSVGGEFQANYTVNLDDPYHAMAVKLGKTLAYDDPDAFLTEKNSEALVLKTGENAETLQGVTVTASKKEEPFTIEFKSATLVGRNDCGDYVCGFGILNCNNHQEGFMPVKGNSYRLPFGGFTIYAGCTTMPMDADKTYVKALSGIYTAKEFYKPDYAQLAPSEAVLQSTIYWNYAVPVLNGKLPELSFATTDVTGNFRVIVQGITTKGAIHAEHLFAVSK